MFVAVRIELSPRWLASTPPSIAEVALLGDLIHAADADGITKHVVGAVIPNAEGKVLLLHRADDDYLGGLWELPSGGVDAGESLTEALHREVAEETGLTVTVIDERSVVAARDKTRGAKTVTRAASAGRCLASLAAEAQRGTRRCVRHVTHGHFPRVL